MPTFKKNTQRTIVFVMIDSTDTKAVKTGLTVAAQVSKDGGAFGDAANSVAEIGSGFYKLLLTAAEMNADGVAVKLTASGAVQQNLVLYTDTKLVSDLADFDPATDDVNLSEADLAALQDGIKGSPGGRTVKEVYAKVESLAGQAVIVQAAVTPAAQAITRYRGDTVPILFDLGRDITGASLAFTVKRRATDAQAAALIAKTSAESSEIEITDAEAGLFEVKLAAGDTADLLPDGRRATFLYDVEMTLDGEVGTVVAGDLVLLPDVTTA